MAELTLQATVDNLNQVLAFVEEKLEENQCSMRIIMQMQIAVEEIYVNIAKYAYNPKIGMATIRIEVGGEPLKVIIQFLDNGKPYNPLTKEDPDITLSAEERDIGGLGIFMVKKSVDDIMYEYKDGKNILTIKKNLSYNQTHERN